MFTALSMLILGALASIFARADPSPNSPGPGDVFIEEKPCIVSWDVDQTGDWTTMHIDLMTGDNFNMVFLANVGVVDATDRDKAVFIYPCPKVTPHSPVYFYQFWTPSSSNKAWTGRFMITDSSGEVVAPSESIQPNGLHIPWGKGALENSTQPFVFPSSFGPSGSPNSSSVSASLLGVLGVPASRPSTAVSSFGVPVRISTAAKVPLVASATTHSSTPASSGSAPMVPSSSGVLKAGQNGAIGMRWSGIFALVLGVFCCAVMF